MRPENDDASPPSPASWRGARRLHGRLSQALAGCVTALGVGTITWALAHSWVPREGVPLRAGCISAALALLGSWILGRFEVAPRWWHGGLFGFAWGAACVPFCGVFALFVYPPLGALAGTFGVMLLRHERRADPSTSLDRLPRALAGAGVWLSLVVLGIVAVAHHYLAPWLRLAALAAVGLSLGAAATAWARARWLRRVATGGDERWRIVQPESPVPELPELSAPGALRGCLIARVEGPGAAYRPGLTRPLARLVPARHLGTALAVALASLASIAALGVDSTDEQRVVARSTLLRSAVEGRRWVEAYAVMSPQYRAAHTLEAFQEDLHDVGHWCSANTPGVDRVKMGWSDAWLFLFGDDIDLGHFARRWVKIDGQWYLTDERDLSLD